jgi:hypothetical protein
VVAAEGEGERVSAREVSADEARALLDGTAPGPWKHRAEQVDPAEDWWSNVVVRADTGRAIAEVVDALRASPDGRLLAAAPDLAATVIALHSRLRHQRDAATAGRGRAEVSADEAQALLDGYLGVRRADGSTLASVSGLSGDRAEVVARLLAAAPNLAATVVALHKRVGASDSVLERERDHAIECAQSARAERDAALAHAEELTRALTSLRAIVEGRTTPPTDAEIAAHDHAGGWWSYLPPPGQSSCTCATCAVHQQPSGEIPRSNVRAVAGLGGGRWWALDSQRRPCAWPTTEVSRG